jgi:hypothetical protein
MMFGIWLLERRILYLEKESICSAEENQLLYGPKSHAWLRSPRRANKDCDNDKADIHQNEDLYSRGASNIRQQLSPPTVTLVKFAISNS